MLENTIEIFQNKTNFPLADFLVEANSFFSNEFNDIVNFYSGNKNTLDRSQIKKLNSLSEKALYLQKIFRDNKYKFNTVDFWELLDIIEDIKVKLSTSQNMSKYLRSTINNSLDKNNGFVFDTILENQETLEDINLKKLKNTYEEDWFDIALENDLKEIDWDISGGKELKLRKKIFQSDLVTSMIDNTVGEKIYGRDIKKKLTFEDDDLKSLDYKETVNQTVEILASLNKGDIPEYREIGIPIGLYKGSNFSRLNYSSIVRELNKNFSTDDLFSNFNVLEMEYKEGDLYIKYEVNTKYELVIIKNIRI